MTNKPCKDAPGKAWVFEVGERSSAGVLESLSIVDAVADFRDYVEIPLFFFEVGERSSAGVLESLSIKK